MEFLDQNTFEIRSLTEEDCGRVTDLELEHYIPNLPVWHLFKVHDTVDRDGLYKRVGFLLKSGIGVGCFERSTNKLVGAIMGEIRLESDQRRPNTVKHSQEMLNMLKFIDWMHRDLHEMLGAKKICMQILAVVDPLYSRKSIYKTMAAKCNEIAKQMSCDYAASFQVSLYSIKGTHKLGWSVLREIKNCDYVDPETGKKPNLEISPIHDRAQLVYLKL